MIGASEMGILRLRTPLSHSHPAVSRLRGFGQALGRTRSAAHNSPWCDISYNWLSRLPILSVRTLANRSRHLAFRRSHGMNLPQSIHPFPARMAASIPWEILQSRRKTKPLVVLDPMAGSGTVPVVARTLGHETIARDVDPLAVLIASVWANDLDPLAFARAAQRVVARSTNWQGMSLASSYPPNAGQSSRRYLRYWFDADARRQLTALASSIEDEPRRAIKRALWCAFSRLIIVKQAGASRAMDVSHSRPHRVYRQAPVAPLTAFPLAIRRIIAKHHFCRSAAPPPAIERGDARNLSHVDDGAVDITITSPPYLNAIDYARGHRLSLAWMGHELDALRDIRSGSVGSEAGTKVRFTDASVARAAQKAVASTAVSKRHWAMLNRYFGDMHKVLGEIARVLTSGGRLVLVIGNSTLRGTYVKNSEGIKNLASEVGLELVSETHRPLPDRMRYLPPPKAKRAGVDFRRRMREEVILTFVR